MRKVGRKNPALVELILVILFFSLSAMVLVQVFVKAKMLSREGRDKTMGILFAQDMIEQWKADPALPEEIFRAAEGWTEETPQGEARIFVSLRDKDMNTGAGPEISSEGTALPVYTARAELTKEVREAGTLYRIKMTVTENQGKEPLTELQTAKYVPNFEEETGP